MKRRSFIKTSLAAGAAMSVPRFASDLAAQDSSGASQTSSVQPPLLPWQREIPLREAAKSVELQNKLDPTNPLPDSGDYFAGPSMSINNLKMRTTIWGPSHRITISLN